MLIFNKFKIDLSIKFDTNKDSDTVKQPTIISDHPTISGPTYKLINRQLVYIFVNFYPTYHTNSESDFANLLNELSDAGLYFVLLYDGATIQRSVPIQNIEKHRFESSACLSFRWKIELDNKTYIDRRLTLQILMRTEQEKSFEGVLTKDILSANNKDRRRLRNFVNSSLQPISNRFSDNGTMSTRISSEANIFILASGSIIVHEPAIVYCQWRSLESCQSLVSVCVENRYCADEIVVSSIDVLAPSSLRVSAAEAEKIKLSPQKLSNTDIGNDDESTQRTPSLEELYAMAATSFTSDWRNTIYVSPLLQGHINGSLVRIAHREAYVFSYIMTRPEGISPGEHFFVPVTIEILMNDKQPALLRSFYVWNT